MSADRESTAVSQRRAKPAGQEQATAAVGEQRPPWVVPVLWLLMPTAAASLVWIVATLAGWQVPAILIPAGALLIAAMAGVVAAVQRRWPGRWYLIPVAAAGLVWAAAAVAGTRGMVSLLPAGALAAAGVAGAVVAVRRLLAQRGLPPRRRRGVRRSMFALAAVMAGLAWLVPATLLGPWRPVLLVTFSAMTVAAVVVWSRVAWVRHRVRADKDVRAWPDIAHQLDIAGAVLRAIVWTRAGRSLQVELAAGQTWRQIRPDQADSVLGVAPGAVTVERDLDSARRVTVHVQDADPWSQGDLMHPIVPHLDVLQAAKLSIPTDRAATAQDLPNYVEEPDLVTGWLPGSASVTDPLPIGERADGQQAGMPLYKPGFGAIHWLVGGQTGGGKTVLMRDIAAGLLRCNNVVVWGIDTAKQGKAFGPWSQQMRVAATLREAVAMLAEARAWIQTSAERSAAEAARGEGADNVEPTPERPMLVILVDEAADIFDATTEDGMSEDADLKYRAVQLAERIGATGRSEAVGMVVETQRPDGSSLGGDSRLRSHFIGGICLRTPNQSEMQWILQGEGADDLDPSVFRHEGLLYLQDGPDVVPSPIRSYALIDPAICARIADVLGPGLPPTPAWLLARRPDQPTATADASAPAAGADSEHQATNTERTSMPKSSKNNAITDAKDAIQRVQGELGEDLDAEGAVPEIDLAEVAAHHDTAPEQIEAADQAATQALLQALTEAGEAGLSRTDAAQQVGIDEITAQRLLGLLERRGHVQGGDGVGAQVQWRIVPTSSPNGHHATSNGNTTGREV